MSGTAKALEHIARIRGELDQLERLLSGTAAPLINLVEPVTAGEIVFADDGEAEIIGGTPTSRFPDCCAIGNESGYYCTGTLIAPTLVVTAKHCNNITRVFFGTNVNQPGNGETIAVLRDLAHPDPEVDIRVLVLAQAARAAPRHVAQGVEVGNPRTAVVAGFGTTDLAGTSGYGVKRYARVPIMSLDSNAVADRQKYGSRAGIELVAGHLGLKLDSCRGDSGGPLYVTDPNGNGDFLLGATSRGTTSALHVCGDGGIYVRVDQVLDWIRGASAIAVCGPLP